MSVHEAPELAAGAGLLDVLRPAPGAQHAQVRAYSAVAIIWYRDMVRYRRDRVRLAASLAQPLLFLVVFGVGLGSSLGGGAGLAPRGSSTPGSVDYVQFIYPGILGMAVLFTSIFSAMSIVWDREFGFLREILVAPINRSSVAVGKTLGGATQAMLQGLILLVVAPLVGVHLTVPAVLALIPLLFVLAFALTAMGVAVATRVHSIQGFQVVMNFLMMPMFFLSGALFPLSGLPGWLTVLTRLDPVAYGIAPIRAVVLTSAGVSQSNIESLGALTIAGHTVPPLLDVAILVAFGGAMLAVAIAALRRRD
jgi:ABC-2 type transport system permease protein